MRNIVQYPITGEEILDVINNIPTDEGIGSLTLMITRGLRLYFTNNPDRLAELVEQFRIK